MRITNVVAALAKNGNDAHVMAVAAAPRKVLRFIVAYGMTPPFNGGTHAFALAACRPADTSLATGLRCREISLDSMAENGGRMVDVWAVNAVRSTTGTAPYAERF